MKTFGFISVNNTYETRKIAEEAKNLYDRFIHIDINKISAILSKDNSVQIFYDNEPVFFNTILTRSVKGINKNKLFPVLRTLQLSGSYLVDPISRFENKGGKLYTSIKRFENSIGPNTYFAFGKRNLLALLEKINYPIIIKPIGGSHSRGIKRIKDVNEGREKLNILFEEGYKSIFIQEKIHIGTEYRVFTLDDEVLHTSRRLRPSMRGEDGEHFGEIDNSRLERLKSFIKEEVKPKGLYGFDIVKIHSQDRYTVVEGNRAPEFEANDRIFNINIAKSIIEKLYERR
ncbi:MAG: hypothetical protein V1663_04040 [archaeon]